MLSVARYPVLATELTQTKMVEAVASAPGVVAVLESVDVHFPVLTGLVSEATCTSALVKVTPVGALGTSVLKAWLNVVLNVPMLKAAKT